MLKDWYNFHFEMYSIVNKSMERSSKKYYFQRCWTVSFSYKEYFQTTVPQNIIGSVRFFSPSGRLNEECAVFFVRFRTGVKERGMEKAQRKADCLDLLKSWQGKFSAWHTWPSASISYSALNFPSTYLPLGQFCFNYVSLPKNGPRLQILVLHAVCLWYGGCPFYFVRPENIFLSGIV